MDDLSDTLRVLQLTGAVFVDVQFSALGDLLCAPDRAPVRRCNRAFGGTTPAAGRRDARRAAAPAPEAEAEAEAVC